MYGENMYDVNSKRYIPRLFSKNKKLFNYEQELRKNMLLKSKKKLAKYQITMVTIDSKNDINDKLLELLNKHQNAKNYHK